MEITESVCAKYAFDADRTSSLLNCAFEPSPPPHRSLAKLPSHGRGPLQWPSGTSSSFVAAESALNLPHSQRIVMSVRSPLVPRSSIHRDRWHLSSLPCTKTRQSISLTWPRRHACTNLTGTTLYRLLSRS